MKSLRLLIPLLLASTLAVAASAPVTAQDLELTADSKPQEGVPKGEVLKFTFENSKLFPGTFRDYWVYVPAQYTPDKPACLYVNQDGLQWNGPTVFDNLIHKKEMPVTIGVYVVHGRVRVKDGNVAQDRFNRSYEYDGLGDRYARFIMEELLPEVESKKTSDGRAIRISKDPNDHAIGGGSSGAVCAFTAAWERPDYFRRVWSAIGTYVGIRGADRYPTLIRKYETKPIRVFLQDGSADQNIYAGDWWQANLMMERALTFAGYEVEHAWGTGGHNGQHGTAIFPDVMRWLWKGWPAPIKGAGPNRNDYVNDVLVPGEDWQLVSEGYQFTEGPAVNTKGELFFNDIPNNKTLKVSADGKVSTFVADSKRANGQAFGPDGRLYAIVMGEQKIVTYDDAGKATTFAEGIAGNDIVVAHNGNVYATAPDRMNPNASKVWLIKPNGEKSVVDTGLQFTNGLTMSPDQTLLYVADSRTHWVFSYQVQPDGTLAHKQQYYHLHLPDTAEDAGADGMRMDRDGRLYVASRLGIQICDQAGRVHLILPTPNGRVSNLSFGGANFDTLYATCGDKVYKRKLKIRGANAWEQPNKPPTPRL
ncbi:MAG: gluconolactonase [Armatimonadetes bacterium]|jgi:sugar lactone lactonase YvrE/enterochelin esterase-like enzyme|nr:gluconolactonase [Armatimonadota bacterium]